jgi:hypothetical protein
VRGEPDVERGQQVVRGEDDREDRCERRQRPSMSPLSAGWTRWSRSRGCRPPRSPDPQCRADRGERVEPRDIRVPQPDAPV